MSGIGIEMRDYGKLRDYIQKYDGGQIYDEPASFAGIRIEMMDGNTLNVCYLNMNIDALPAILDELLNNPKLTIIHFDWNDLSDKEGLIVAEALLDERCAWTELYLTHNNFGARAVQKIVENVKDNIILKTLCVNQNGPRTLFLADDRHSPAPECEFLLLLECNHSIECFEARGVLDNVMYSRVNAWLFRNKQERLQREEETGRFTKSCC